jgi:hypothetical protein
MVARVSDFGIARLVSVVDDTSHQESSTIGIKGTVGYAPPGILYTLRSLNISLNSLIFWFMSDI